MQTLLYVSLFLVGLVALNELSYIGSTSLALVVIALATAIGLQAIYLIQKK